MERMLYESSFDLMKELNTAINCSDVVKVVKLLERCTDKVLDVQISLATYRNNVMILNALNNVKR